MSKGKNGFGVYEKQLADLKCVVGQEDAEETGLLADPVAGHLPEEYGHNRYPQAMMLIQSTGHYRRRRGQGLRGTGRPNPADWRWWGTTWRKGNRGLGS